MAGIDSVVGIAIIITFLLIIGSSVYKHEKEHLDPLIKTIKGWFHKEEETYTDNSLALSGDYDLDFRGKLR